MGFQVVTLRNTEHEIQNQFKFFAGGAGRRLGAPMHRI